MPRFQLRTYHLVILACLVLAWRWWAVERVIGPVRELDNMGVDVGFATPFSPAPEREYWQRFVMGHLYEDLPHTVSIRRYDAEWMPKVNDQMVSQAAVLIHKLSSIDSLRLDAPGITGASLPAVAQLRRLRQLTLGNVTIGDGDLAALSQLKQLRELRLERTQLTDQGIQKLRAALPDCEIVRGPIPLF